MIIDRGGAGSPCYHCHFIRNIIVPVEFLISLSCLYSCPKICSFLSSFPITPFFGGLVGFDWLGCVGSWC